VACSARSGGIFAFWIGRNRLMEPPNDWESPGGPSISRDAKILRDSASTRLTVKLLIVFMLLEGPRYLS
jgi:hypothetical protein